MTDIDVTDHDRIMVASVERSRLRYLWGSVGTTLLLTLALVGYIVLASVFPAFAEELHVDTRPILKGFRSSYEGTDIVGPAAQDVKAYMQTKYMSCYFEEKEGRCPLGNLADAVVIHYFADAGQSYAVALIAYEQDTGTLYLSQTAMWRRNGSNRYDLLADSSGGWNITATSVVAANGSSVVLKGTTVGPKDLRCCGTALTYYKITVADGKMTFEDRRADPWPSGQVSAWSGPDPLQTWNGTRAWRGNAGYNEDNFGGEHQQPFVHNGSYVQVFPDHGVIAYYQPKASLQGLVAEGDAIFEGTFDRSGISGTAYVFKAGCPPLGYSVKGGRYRSSGDAFVLKGAAPVHAKDSCAVVGMTTTGSNAVLRFEPGGGYNEPQFVENGPRKR
jgi:hypothetical protein